MIPNKVISVNRTTEYNVQVNYSGSTEWVNCHSYSIPTLDAALADMKYLSGINQDKYFRVIMSSSVTTVSVFAESFGLNETKPASSDKAKSKLANREK